MHQSSSNASGATPQFSTTSNLEKKKKHTHPARLTRKMIFAPLFPEPPSTTHPAPCVQSRCIGQRIFEGRPRARVSHAARSTCGSRATRLYDEMNDIKFNVTNLSRAAPAGPSFPRAAFPQYPRARRRAGLLFRGAPPRAVSPARARACDREREGVAGAGLVRGGIVTRTRCLGTRCGRWRVLRISRILAAI